MKWAKWPKHLRMFWNWSVSSWWECQVAPCVSVVPPFLSSASVLFVFSPSSACDGSELDSHPLRTWNMKSDKEQQTEPLSKWWLLMLDPFTNPCVASPLAGHRGGDVVWWHARLLGCSEVQISHPRGTFYTYKHRQTCFVLVCLPWTVWWEWWTHLTRNQWQPTLDTLTTWKSPNPHQGSTMSLCLFLFSFNETRIKHATVIDLMCNWEQQWWVAVTLFSRECDCTSRYLFSSTLTTSLSQYTWLVPSQITFFGST